MPGERAVRELLEAAPRRVDRVLVDERRPFPELRRLAEAAGVAVEVVSAEVLARRAPGVETRGVLALSRPPAEIPLDAMLSALEEGDPQARQVVVALDEVADPQNLGAIMRSCEFFGARGLLWTKDRAAQVTPAAVRASAGASERLPLCTVTNLASALRSCKDAGLWVVGTVADEGEPLRSMVEGDRLPSRLVVVMGSEGKGLRRLTREHCDFLVTIDRRGAVGSLNVSAATAVVLSWLLGRG